MPEPTPLRAAQRGSTDRAWEEALEWLLTLQQRSSGPVLQQRLQDWLDADPRHRAAFAEARRVWDVAGAIEPLRAEWPRPRERRWRVPSAVAAALALVALLLLPEGFERLRHDMVTGSGELRTEALPDGSRVTLAAGSAVDFSLGDQARTLTLHRGAVFLEVARDDTRAFVVEAAGTRISVLGTHFSVRRTPDGAEVAVAEGRVRVERSRTSVTLAAGEAVTATRDGLARRAVLPRNIGLWRDHRLVVKDVTVAEAIEALRPWHRGFIYGPEGALAQRRISGIYDLGRPEAALAAMVAPYDARVSSFTPWLLRVEPR